MSEITIVGPPRDADWRLEPRDVAAAFQRDWPGSRISWSQEVEADFAFNFELETERGLLDGRLDKEGQSLLIHHGWDQDVAALVIWFRRLVPANEALEAWSDSGRTCQIMPDMAEGDFLRYFR